MRKKSNVCFGSFLQLFTISDFLSDVLTFLCTEVTLADTGSGRWKFKQLKGPIIPKKWIVITSIPGQYIDEASANHGLYWCVS